MCDGGGGVPLFLIRCRIKTHPLKVMEMEEHEQLANSYADSLAQYPLEQSMASTFQRGRMMDREKERYRERERQTEMHRERVREKY